MNLKTVLLFSLLGLCGLFAACKPTHPPTRSTTTTNAANAPAESQVAGPLPDSGFNATIKLPDPPAKLRTGEIRTINITVKNNSNTIWWRRGGQTTNRTDNKFYIAAANRWLDKDGKPTSETEGHNGIPKDLKPGEETEMTIQITAPKQPGEWTMQLDLVQEGVAWFSEKGSTATNIKVQVVK
jgi:hypothetical protein